MGVLSLCARLELGDYDTLTYRGPRDLGGRLELAEVLEIDVLHLAGDSLRIVWARRSGSSLCCNNSALSDYIARGRSEKQGLTARNSRGGKTAGTSNANRLLSV